MRIAILTVLLCCAGNVFGEPKFNCSFPKQLSSRFSVHFKAGYGDSVYTSLLLPFVLVESDSNLLEDTAWCDRIAETRKKEGPNRFNLGDCAGKVSYTLRWRKPIPKELNGKKIFVSLMDPTTGQTSRRTVELKYEVAAERSTR